ncbi:kinase-like protein [Rhizopogon salebrosus TDB-379]|nr:kinase-like protein [Rhizopogon salebrosus TDB-379]
MQLVDWLLEPPSHSRNKGIRREAHIWANLKDDHVLSLHGIAIGFGVLPAFVSSWMTNGSLESYLRSHTSLSTSRKLVISMQRASGLKYLHEKGIVHGDLTPNNVLIDGNDKLCLADFGLSMILAESGNPTFNSCHPGNMRWMAPEMLSVPQQGESMKPTKPTDVYSHGFTFWTTALLDADERISHFRGKVWRHRALRSRSVDAHARPKVQEVVEFMKAELRKR